MKNKGYLLFFVLLVFLFLGSLSSINAQTAHSDPAILNVVSTFAPIKVDGVLNELDWQRRYDFLAFGANAQPGDVIYTVTSGITVDSGYIDTSTTYVKFMHDGLKLYIALQSNDKSICRRSSGWEGDGLFMKIKKANGTPIEFHLFYNQAGVGAPIHVETNINPNPYDSTTLQGAGVVINPGIVNDNSAPDSGYTAEMMIDLSKLGYTDPYGDIPVLVNIFDPNGFTDSVTTGNYYKSWWGSEWGVSGSASDWRILRLSDPPLKVALQTNTAITLDGKLDEPFWKNADSIVIGKGSNLSTGGFYQQWASKTATLSPSMMTVKFAHKGTDLYVGATSTDKSVCQWSPGWEADGLFLWITNKDDYEPIPANRMEIHAMYFGDSVGSGIQFQLSSTTPAGSAEGKSFEPVGTITHSEIGGVDNGYSLEVVIHTDQFGYSVGDSIRLSAVAWDVNYGDALSYSADTSTYAPNWWGTQWADKTFEKYDMYRKVVLSTLTDVNEKIGKQIPQKYSLLQNYPNPFNPSTTIEYSLPQQSNVTISIYNSLGQLVKTLVNNELKAPGNYRYSFNASKLSSGVYFYQLKTGNFVQTNKMLLLK
jgi:hypothetical protein